MSEDLNNTADKKVTNTGKQAVFYQMAEDYYIKKGFPISAIIALIGDAVTDRTLRNWREKFGWDDKRKKYLLQNQQQLVKARTILDKCADIAEADPSPKNLLAYQRAMNVVRSLEGVEVISPDEKDESEEGKGLTPENAEKIRKEILGLG
jgi:hypothetical protein